MGRPGICCLEPTAPTGCTTETHRETVTVKYMCDCFNDFVNTTQWD